MLAEVSQQRRPERSSDQADAAGSPAQELLSTATMFACVQVGTDNPCRCKVLGPTVGFVVGALAACILWPLGALSYCCCRGFADRSFGTPVGVFNSIANAAPI